MTIRTFSYGGGVQSTAALVLAARGTIDYPLFLFANVGDDSEHPDTLRYVWDVAMPYAAAHGIELVELRRTRRGAPWTLYQEITDEVLTGMPIPLHMENGAPGRRSCTKHFKVQVIAKETKRRGATPDDPAIIGLGISIDEYQRMRTDSPVAWHRNDYPLIDLRLSRDDCRRIIAEAGLAQPGKSACWFCPYTRRGDWQRMAATNPDLYMQAVVLEQDILAKERRAGKSGAHYLTRYGRPLYKVIGEQAMMDFDEPDDVCESGHCMT
jgi:hypothetical protein